MHKQSYVPLVCYPCSPSAFSYSVSEFVIAGYFDYFGFDYSDDGSVKDTKLINKFVNFSIILIKNSVKCLLIKEYLPRVDYTKNKNQLIQFHFINFPENETLKKNYLACIS